jgi:hypothetical protein
MDISIIIVIVLHAVAFGLGLGYFLIPSEKKKSTRKFTGKPKPKGISLPADLWDLIEKRIENTGDEMITPSSFIKNILVNTI